MYVGPSQPHERQSYQSVRHKARHRILREIFTSFSSRSNLRFRSISLGRPLSSTTPMQLWCDFPGLEPLYLHHLLPSVPLRTTAKSAFFLLAHMRYPAKNDQGKNLQHIPDVALAQVFLNDSASVSGLMRNGSKFVISVTTFFPARCAILTDIGCKAPFLENERGV